MRLLADNAGQMTIEWALVLAAIALPMYFVFILCMRILVAHFQMVTFMETLPFP
jgi:ABC-type sulfate transport system permease subunit